VFPTNLQHKQIPQHIINIPLCQHTQQAAATVSDEMQWQSAEMNVLAANI